MQNVVLHVTIRSELGKQGAKALRRSGRLPGIFYGHGVEPRPISVEAKDILKMVQEEVTLFNAVFPDQKKPIPCILKEIQRDPVTDEPIHVDLMAVKMEEKIRMTIPVVFKGIPIGVKEGGILEHALREVEVEGLPLSIPEHLEVDVSSLKIGESLTLADLHPEGFRFITDIHHPVAHVTIPRVKAVTAEEAPAAQAEQAAEES